MPGDRIVGILTPGEGITIYPIQSPALTAFDDQPERWLDVRWDLEDGRPRVLSGAHRRHGDQRARRAWHDRQRDRRSRRQYRQHRDPAALGRLPRNDHRLEVHDLKHLNGIISNLRVELGGEQGRAGKRLGRLGTPETVRYRFRRAGSPVDPRPGVVSASIDPRSARPFERFNAQGPRLGVNVDHVATLRNARGGRFRPVARPSSRSPGADGITAHLREDRRHIRDDDMARLKREISTPLNFEMAATDEMVAIALETRPHACCLVPERRSERTTEGGLDVARRPRSSRNRHGRAGATRACASLCSSSRALPP